MLESSESVGAKPEDLNALIARLLASSGLKRSPRLSELLLYLLNHTVAGSDLELREQTIGVKVFGRPEGYDTAADSIVRASVFLLRKKLTRYFAEAGANESLVCTIPKGSYAVTFHVRDPLGPEKSTSDGERADKRVSEPLGRFSNRRIFIAIAAMLVLSASVALFFRWDIAPRQKRSNAVSHRFWSKAFGPERVVNVVVADSGFSLLQDIGGLRLTLDDYRAARGKDGNRSYGNLPPELVHRLLHRDYTSVLDSSVAFRLGGVFKALGIRATVRAARAVDAREFKTNDFVLLGSMRANPWASLLSNQVDFKIDFDIKSSRSYVQDVRPDLGTSGTWYATARAEHPGDTYGVIAFVPNLGGTGHILSIGGTNMEGTEAAADMLLNDALFDVLAQRLKLEDDGKLPHFEALIRARSIGAGLAQEIVAVKVKNSVIP